MSDHVLQHATDYWGEKRRAERMPTRRSIDVVEAGALTPHLVISEVTETGRGYRHEHAGAAATSLLGGVLDDDKAGGSLMAWRRGLDAARMYCAPHFATFAGTDGGMVRAVFLPLCRNAGESRPAYVLSALVADAAE